MQGILKNDSWDKNRLFPTSTSQRWTQKELQLNNAHHYDCHLPIEDMCKHAYFSIKTSNGQFQLLQNSAKTVISITSNFHLTQDRNRLLEFFPMSMKTFPMDSLSNDHSCFVTKLLWKKLVATSTVLSIWKTITANARQ